MYWGVQIAEIKCKFELLLIRKFGGYYLDSVKQKLDDIANDISKCSEIGASAIVDKNGIVVSSCTNCGGDSNLFGTMSAVMFGAANIASNDSGIGIVHRVTVHSKHNTLITENSNSNSNLLVSIMTEKEIEQIHYKIDKTIEKFRSALNDIPL